MMSRRSRGHDKADKERAESNGLVSAIFRGWSRANVSRMMLLGAFGISMGHVEAVVVVYIRRILGWIPASQALTADVAAKVPGWIIAVEQTREAATIIMLACLALLAGRNGWQRVGSFFITFGVWDITYYVSLKCMIDWPASPATMDLLFLIPRHWYAPVWVPILISVGLIVGGLSCLRLSQPKPQ